MEAKKRETTSEFKYEGRTFRINSYDPMEGNYILTQVLAFALPFGLKDTLLKTLNTGSETKVEIPEFITQKPMGKNDFISLQSDILKTIEEVYESGNISPVVRQNGTYGVADVTMGLVLNLLIASLAFNFKSFFEDAQLTEFLTLG